MKHTIRSLSRLKILADTKTCLACVVGRDPAPQPVPKMPTDDTVRRGGVWRKEDCWTTRTPTPLTILELHVGGVKLCRGSSRGFDNRTVEMAEWKECRICPRCLPVSAFTCTTRWIPCTRSRSQLPRDRERETGLTRRCPPFLVHLSNAWCFSFLSLNLRLGLSIWLLDGHRGPA